MIEDNIIYGEGDRSTIVALAKDNTTKSAFIFNTSAELRQPSNHYKELLDFFEIRVGDMNDLLSLNGGEYKFEGYTYKILEHLPLPNYNREDQKEINVVKKRYIDAYNDENYVLYNQTLNEKAKEKLTTTHNGNVIKLYNDLYYKRLQKFYDDLDELRQYDLIDAYVKDKERVIVQDVTNTELSKRYFKGDKDAGIELVLRKEGNDVIVNFLYRYEGRNYDKIKKIKDDFPLLVKTLKAIYFTGYIGTHDLDVQTVRTILENKFCMNAWGIWNYAADKSEPTVKEYFDKRKDNSELKSALDNDYNMLRNYIKGEIFYKYMDSNDVKMKQIYLYALYEKLQSKKN